MHVYLQEGSIPTTYFAKQIRFRAVKIVFFTEKIKKCYYQNESISRMQRTKFPLEQFEEKNQTVWS